jgi:hypothetical protein
MRNKFRTSGFQKIVSRLLYDYIDYGNAFCDVEYVHEKHIDPATGEEVDGYIGPRAVRISPNDSIKSDGFTMDGFGTIQDYYQSGYVELLEFEGDISDEHGIMHQNRLITVIDRQHVLRDDPNPSWTGSDGKSHVGWRMRPDNLYGMGPLDNLVGMQYRIDHLENIKADLFDFIAHPPLKVKGTVEAFDWAPFVQIELGEDGDVEILKVDATALQADTQIAILEQRMEEMAGAPREAMGIRSPGEKTAFEVQKLDDAASRIFQEKIRQFEIFLLEPLMNNMLEVARRNLSAKDALRTMDDDRGVVQFMDISKEDLKASGNLRAKGATHFAARNLLVQNLTTVFNSTLGEKIGRHVSSIRLAKLMEEAFGWQKHELVSENIEIKENAKAQREMNMQEDTLANEQAVAAEEPITDEGIPIE